MLCVLTDLYRRRDEPSVQWQSCILSYTLNLSIACFKLPTIEIAANGHWRLVPDWKIVQTLQKR